MFQETLIIGIVVDPGKLQYTPAGEASILFTVKTTRRFQDFDTRVKVEATIWRISAWNHWAEWADQNLRAETWVQIRGRLSPDEMTGGPRVRFLRQTSQYVAAYDLVAREMMIWGGLVPDPEHMPLELETEVGGDS